ncbi:MAG: hypothetical protein M3Y27_03325 [Acidobacteriota bacterium]|nr:hypothetical protein [Acidobacteriota bacterium]
MMKRKQRYFAAGCSFVLFTGALLYAFKAGPDPRHTGAPGDDPLACTSSGCHTGVPLNAGGGKVEVQFPNGLTYTPGQQQMLTVKVTDTAEKFYGFQMTARLASEPVNGQAGDFTAGPNQGVLCDDGIDKSSKGCRANATVQFIEHSTPSTTGVWTVAWTPPSEDVGDVFIYIAGNSNTQDQIPDKGHVYTAQYTLNSDGSGASKPTITAAQVAAGFNAKAQAASGTWLEIYGSNLAASTRQWAGADFNGVNAPTSLNRTSVTVNGKPAFVDIVSPGQVNVQVPDDPQNGTARIVVTNPAGDSPPFMIPKAPTAPALLAPASFLVGGKQYVFAVFQDGAATPTYVGKTNLIGGLKFRPAKANDIIALYGIGFGPVNPDIPAGVIPTVSTSLKTLPTFRFGQTPATLTYYGLVQGSIGLYQFNIKVPSAATGDQLLTVDIGGVSANPNLFITMQ